MIFNVMTWGGSPDCDLTIQGAPGETVTITGGAEPQTVLLDDSGNGAITVAKGAYTFSGSISQKAGIVLENIDVKGPRETVKMWGNVRPIYWFGRMGQDDAGGPIIWEELTKKGGGGGVQQVSITKNKNDTNMYINLKGDAGKWSYTKINSPLIDITGYQTVSFVASFKEKNSGDAHAGIATDNAVTVDYSSLIAGNGIVQSENISSETGRRYIGFCSRTATAGSYYNYINTLCKAIWLE